MMSSGARCVKSGYNGLAFHGLFSPNLAKSSWALVVFISIDDDNININSIIINNGFSDILFIMIY